MLILTRSTGQAIFINDDIEVRILSVHRGQIRIGITAPKNVSVHREEVRERIEQEKNSSGNK